MPIAQRPAETPILSRDIYEASLAVRRVECEPRASHKEQKRKMNNEDGCCRSALVIVAQDEKSSLGCNPPCPLTAGA